MIVTIDGPAGAGKSSVSKQLAERLGYQFLDTGAMYRAVTWSALSNRVDLLDSIALADHATGLRIELDGDRTRLNGADVSVEIRSQEVNKSIKYVADHPVIREQLVSMQREIASDGDYVCEGRDQGTVAFPDAECKIFLTASLMERGSRRFRELREQGQQIDEEEILKSLRRRDANDTSRKFGALRKADDAVEVCTDNMTYREVVDKLELIVRLAMEKSPQQ